MYRKLLLSTAIVAVSFNLAFAADPVVADDPAPVFVDEARFDWSGAYWGVFGGYGSADYSGISDGADVPTRQNPLDTLGAEGGVFGALVGWNVQAGNIVYGIEADANWSGIEGESYDGFDGTISSSIDWTASLRGRIGVSQKNALVYVTGGAAYVAGDFSFECNTIGVCTPANGGTTDLSGFTWVVGGGVEFAVDNSWSYRIEALYYAAHDISKSTENLSIIDSDPGDFAQFDSIGVVRFGITRKF